jgi:hypothetical protein
MFDIRSISLIAALFAVGFFGVRWITAGAPVPVFGVADLKPDARVPTFVEKSRKDIAEMREQEWLASKTAQGDDDPERNKLRAAVVAAATAFTLSPCNSALKQQYLEAAAAYARAFVTLGGCPDYPACTPNDALMERANQVFKSPADGRVKQAIRAVHDMGITVKDYPGKFGQPVAHLSGSGVPFGEEGFSCTSPRARAAKPIDDKPIAAPPPQRNAAITPDRKQIDRDRREHYRNRMIEDLRRPGPAWCRDPGRRLFISGLNQYYVMRFTAQHGNAVRTREEQLEVEQAWSTALDQQIDVLVRDFFVAGYFRRQDLQKSPLIDQVLSGATSTGHACDNG